MRIAVGLIMHEADIFSPLKATLEDCRQTHLLFGEDMLRFHRGRETELNGIIKVADKEGITLFPTVSTMPIPNGVFANETYSFLKQELLDRLARIKDLDGVLLVLHGSAATEDLDDAEGDLLEAVRNLVGGTIPVVGTLDFHANVSQRMVENADALIGYKTCPHMDHVATGERAVRLILSLIRRKVKPAAALEKLPMLIPYSSTFAGPMKRLMGRAAQIEAEEEILSVSLFDAQVEAGMRDLGRCVVVVGEHESTARQKATELRQMWWDLRHEFRSPRISTDEAIALIKNPPQEPLIFSARGDDPFSGAPGDATFLLKKVLENNVQKAAVACIPDPESVQKAVQAGLGATVTLQIGGKMDNVYNSPVEISGTVEHVTQGRYSPQVSAVCDVDMGRAVALRTGDTDIILTERRMPAWDPDFLRHFSVDPQEKRVFVLKACGPRWDEINRNRYGVDTPGCFNSGLILDWVKQENIKLDFNYWEE